MKKLVDIENCLGNSKMQKYLKKRWQDFFKKYLKIGDFKNIFFQLIKIAYFQIFFKNSSQSPPKYFCIFRVTWHFFKSSEFFKMIFLQMSEL